MLDANIACNGRHGDALDQDQQKIGCFMYNQCRRSVKYFLTLRVPKIGLPSKIRTRKESVHVMDSMNAWNMCDEWLHDAGCLGLAALETVTFCRVVYLTD